MLVTVHPFRRSSIFDFTAGVLPDDVTVTRASAATMTSPTGVVSTVGINQPRWSNGGLLIEPGSTTLLTYSQDFTQSVWAKNGGLVATPNNRLAPDGTMTATKMEFLANSRLERYSGIGNQNTTVTTSAWLYSTIAQNVRFGLYANTSGQVAPTTMLPANTWIRLTATKAFTTDTDRRVWLLEQYVPVTIWVWGWQLEYATTESSYVPTTTASATRAADTITLNWKDRGTADGTINVRYTFDDNSTQDGTMVVASGKATIPTNLNRRSLKKVALL